MATGTYTVINADGYSSSRDANTAGKIADAYAHGFPANMYVDKKVATPNEKERTKKRSTTEHKSVEPAFSREMSRPTNGRVSATLEVNIASDAKQ